jgi:phosphoglycerate kinase
LGVPRLEDLSLEPGTRVLLRADFNVPLSGSTITDDLRIRAALPTIAWLRDRGAAVIACSHLGRPKGAPDPKYSLAPVAARLGELLGAAVPLAPGVVGPEVQQACAALEPGGVLLLDNLRFEPGETANDPAFAEALSALAAGGAYVNDAFGAAHRAHASVVGPPARLPSAAGRLLEREVEVLSQLLAEPARPFVGVLGGVKVSDKLGVIEALLDHCDRILVGGAMCFTFLAAQGHGTGDSLVEPDFTKQCAKLLESGRVLIPTDVVVAPEMKDDAPAEVVSADAIPAGMKGLDIGPATGERYAAEIAAAALVFWNGPMGVFEMAPFAAGTKRVAQAVAEAGGFTVVGGGDSAAALKQFGLDSRVDHISTGGGASLEYLEQGDLPGLQALRDAATRGK